MIFYITSLFYLTLGIIILLFGFVILKENPRQRINRITALMMFFAGSGPIFGAFGILFQNATVPSGDFTLLRKLFLVWEFFFPQLLLFSFVFPRENQWIKKHQWLAFLIFLPHLAHFFLVLTFTSVDEIYALIDLQGLLNRFGLLLQPITILLGLLLSLIGLIYEFHTNFFALVNLIYFIGAIAIMILAQRSIQNSRLRKQVGLVLWGIRVSVGFYTIAFIFPRLHLLHTSRIRAHSLTTLALLSGGISIAWAMIRYQFMDIRLIIRRGLVFSVTSVFFIGIFLLIYTHGKQIVTNIVGADIPILEVIFIVLALFFFQPIFNLLERFGEGLFMRDRLDYRNVIQELSQDIMVHFDFDQLQNKITHTLKEAMTVEHVGFMIPDAQGQYCCNRGDQTICVDPQTEWIQLLQTIKRPLGFDELSRRIGDEQSLEALRRLNTFILVPFIHREHLIGLLCVGEKITKMRFSAEDMMVLSVLANQTAIAIENSRLYQEALEKQRIQEELNVAREIQGHLLPKQGIMDDQFELVGYNLPSKEVGGDYFDFIPLDQNKIGIAIGDISGKGVPAALLMSNLQAVLRISAIGHQSSCDVTRQVNRQITATTSLEKYATFFYGILDPGSMVLEYTNAGHNYPILWHQNNSHKLLKEGGLIVGVKSEVNYQSEKIQLLSGDTLVFYTDGVTEARHLATDEEYGENRLLKILRTINDHSAQSILDGILSSISEFTKGCLQSDDLTLMVLKVK